MPLTNFQRTLLAAGSAFISITNPYRGDMIACLGETTGENALIYCQQRLQCTAEGQRILDQRPRINSSTIDLMALKNLPDGTIGKIYSSFLEVNVRTFFVYFIKFLFQYIKKEKFHNMEITFCRMFLQIPGHLFDL